MQTYKIDVHRLESSMSNLVKLICVLEHQGDKDAVDKTFKDFGQLDKETKQSLERLKDIPVDIRPCYPLAGEECTQWE